MSSIFFRTLAVGAAAVAICVVCLCLAHACEADLFDSVHFNSAQPDFGAPPRSLSISSWEEEADRPIGCVPSVPWSEEEYHRQRRWETQGSEALRNARRLEAAGRFAEAMPHYRNALKHGAGELAAITDREELLEELTPATEQALLNDYLSARRDYEFSRPGRGEQQMQALADDPHAGILRAHALYVLGAIQYETKHPVQAAAIFERLATDYPQSRRREAALIMIPRSLLQVPAGADSFTAWVGKDIPGGNALPRARHALHTLLQEYPHTRFRQSALGWRARCDLLQGHRVTALESYLHQYATFTGESERESAAASILFISEKLTPGEAKQLGADVRRNADVLGDYLEYRLDHNSDTAGDLARLAELATAVAGNHRLHLRARSAARLAETQYLRGRYHDAITWSTRALSSLPGPGYDLALYVRGACYRKTEQGAASEADFHQLLRLYPASYLCGAARENLALLYENSGRPGLALDQYYLLGYQEDIAYLLDARMTTDQVTVYLNTHPHHPQRNLLIYTLGIRQLRDNQLTQAQATLSRLPEQTIHALMEPPKTEAQNDEQQSEINDPQQAAGFLATQAQATLSHLKEQTLHALLGQKIIVASGDALQDHLCDPRQTARELAHLERAIPQAHGPNAQAEARYAEASYLYTNRDLLFYNYALWQGERSKDFSLYWNVRVATHADLTAARAHHFAHECLYRALTQCLEIARQYPQSPTAPKALYRAACSAHYLANFDGWWRKEAVHLHLDEESIHLMKRVYQQYPHDPLAISARKFARAFAEENAEAGRDTMFEVAKR